MTSSKVTWFCTQTHTSTFRQKCWSTKRKRAILMCVYMKKMYKMIRFDLISETFRFAAWPMVDGLHIYISCSLMTLCFSVAPTAYNSIHGLHQGCQNHCNLWVTFSLILVLSEPDHFLLVLKNLSTHFINHLFIKLMMNTPSVIHLHFFCTKKCYCRQHGS